MCGAGTGCEWGWVGGGRLVFGFIDGWMEVVGLGMRWFHCMAFSESEFTVRRSTGVL